MNPASNANPPRVTIERMAASDGHRLRSIRLRALQDAPDAFGTTWEEAVQLLPETWDRQLEQLATFVATTGDSDVGLARGARHEHLDQAGFLLSVWVAPEARRQGVASQLIDAVIDWARAEGLRRLLLDVGERNSPAIALYLRKGFQPNGATGALPPPREHIREIQLELKL